MDDGSCSSLTHQHQNPITEGYQICQALFALSEAMLVAINALMIFHVPLHNFQEDVLHDLAGHLGETNWYVVPWVMFPVFQAVNFLLLVSPPPVLHKEPVSIHSSHRTHPIMSHASGQLLAGLGTSLGFPHLRGEHACITSVIPLNCNSSSLATESSTQL